MLTLQADTGFRLFRAVYTSIEQIYNNNELFFCAANSFFARYRNLVLDYIKYTVAEDWKLGNYFYHSLYTSCPAAHKGSIILWHLLTELPVSLTKPQI